ncbi:biotin/lipoyl-containing protein [Pantoea sp. 18069]|uniref:biotin/lipoyl-containing protein n=1 Tax=Pantoea sp. 18069 TaxID=2681415 RepID=UPI001359F9FD|nr:biotin/lipoyl-containing protein [Pantoea sp. 18069]
MQIERIAQWLQRMPRSAITRLECTLGQATLRVVLPAVAAPRTPATTTTVCASGFGVFHPLHPLQPQLGAQVGRQVQAGEALGFIEVCGILTALPAPAAGTVTALCAAAGQWVQYGQALVQLELRA